MRTLLLSSGFAGLLLLAGCGDLQLDPNTRPDEDITGSISGRICAPTGDAWLENAYVYANIFNESGAIAGIRETWTDRDGYFVLSGVPESSLATVYVQKGTFQTSLQAEVKRGALTRLSDPLCLDPLSVNAAVVLGAYDDFSAMLDRVGITHYTTVEGEEGSSLQAFFSDLDGLLGYDLICVNGGVLEAGVLDQSSLVQNVTAYVEAGGSLFATDWSYDVVEQAFPEAVDFLGDDTRLSAAQRGDKGAVMARVVDQSLAGYLGHQSVEIRYDLELWPLIEASSGQVVVHVTGDVSYDDGTESLLGAPLLVSFSAGYGTVVYSTFRQGANLEEDMAQILQYMLYRL